MNFWEFFEFLGDSMKFYEMRMARCVMWAYIWLRRGHITRSLLAFGSTETGAIEIEA
jgi:hypothetical protein